MKNQKFTNIETSTTDLSLTSNPLEAIKHICDIRQSVFGLDYLQELIDRFCDFYGLEYGMIGRPKQRASVFIETQMLLANGKIQENLEYELAGSPCENVINGGRICLYEDGVCDQFPDDLLLADMQVKSYIGARLLSPERKLLGILVFMSTDAFEPNDSMITVLDFVASRVGMELEREDLNLQIKLREQEENRDKRLASLGQLVNGVAHDFNNLLAGVLGHAELLQLKLGENEVAKPHIDGVLNSVMRATNLTSELMNFSNPQANLEVVTDVCAVLAEIEQLVTVQAKCKSIQLVINSEASLFVKIDGSHFQQILLNLMLNAIDASDTKGEITVSASRAMQDGKPFVELSVRDNGAGIAESEIEHIFDPFFTTKAVGKGSGLGLASVHSIVQSYDGSVSVTSKIGAGSHFRVMLPEAEDSILGTLREDMTGKSFDGVKVLFAEDDEEIAQSMPELMRNKGLCVTAVKDGAQAKAAIDEQARKGDNFDLVVADLNMPNVMGDELFRYARQHYPDLKFIVSTGDPSLLGRDDAVEQVCSSSLLVKPYAFDSLIEKIDILLDSTPSV